MKNKIILFSNIKGGVGKSTLCAMFATYCAEKGIGVAVVDADLQKSLVRQRDREKSASNDTQEPWQILSIDTSSVDEVTQMFENLKSIPGWILVDCPGNLNDNGLQPIFAAADAFVVPISYEDIVVDATSIFVKVLRKISKAPMIFLPNRINDMEGTKYEREQRFETIRVLGQLGLVTARIKQSVVIKRFSTLFALDNYQTKAVECAFNAIIEKLNH